MNGITAVSKLYIGLQMIQDSITKNTPLPSFKGLSTKMEGVVARGYTYNGKTGDDPLPIVHIINVSGDNDNPFMLIVVDDDKWRPFVDQYMNNKMEPSIAAIISYKYFEETMQWNLGEVDDIMQLFKIIAGYDITLAHAPQISTMCMAQDMDFITRISSYEISVSSAVLYYANKTLDMWISEPFRTHENILQIVEDYLRFKDFPSDTDDDVEWSKGCINIIDEAFRNINEHTIDENVSNGAFNILL